MEYAYRLHTHLVEARRRARAPGGFSPGTLPDAKDADALVIASEYVRVCYGRAEVGDAEYAQVMYGWGRLRWQVLRLALPRR